MTSTKGFRPRLTLATMGLALIWLGLLLGVSFLATPVKFAAPTLSLAAAIDVGRVTFAAFSKMEWALTIGLAVLAIRVFGLRQWGTLAAGLTALCVLLQGTWLLPFLDARADVVIAGGEPSGSPLHTVYIGLEGVKLIALGMVAFLSGRQVISR